MRAALLPVLALLAATGVPALRAQSPAPPTVRSVGFDGVRAVERGVLEAAVETRRGEPLDTAALRADEGRIEAVYGAWGFPAADATAEVRDRGGRPAVVFRVAEGEPLRVRSLVVRGVDTLAPPLRLPVLPLRVGEPYALPLLEATQRLIAGELAERGYAFAQVEAAGGAAAGDVVLEVAPGPVAVFGPVEVRAEAPLTEADVRARLAYRAGERFSTGALERTRERLFALPVVDSARVEFAPAPEGGGVVATRITVGTGRVRAAQGTGGISSTRCLQAAAWWGSRYFLGAPRTFTLTVGTANLLREQLDGSLCRAGADDEEGAFTDPDYLLRGELREPLGPAGWLLLDAGVRRETEAGAYVRRGVDARLGVVRELARGLQGMLAYAPERADNPAGALFFCGVYGACSAAEGAALTDAATLAPLEASLAWSSAGARAAVPGPRTGPAWLRQLQPDGAATARVALAAAGAPTGSEYDFARALLEGSATRFVGSRVELGARGRAAVLLGGDAPLPPQARLFGGGPAGTRGAAANLLGPGFLLLRADSAPPACAAAPGGCAGQEVDPERVLVRATGGDALLEAGVEGRVWVAAWAQLAAFLDYGTVWSGAGDRAPAGLPASGSLLSPGVGLRLLRPAPFRVDLAVDTSPARRYPLLARSAAGGGYVQLGEVVYDPFGRGGAKGWTELRRRIRVQLSSGFTF
ncbi:MAG TPA: POTRA domain-containing protein [Longimicrobiaceae bacterium]|jgi:outer membrane protein assembly factor BamA